MRRLFPFIIILFLLIAFGCDTESAAPSRPLIKIDGLEISKADFLLAFQGDLQPGQQLSPAENQDLQRSFLVHLIDRELIFKEVERLAINATPAELEAAVQDHRKDYPDQEFDTMLQERGLTLARWQNELKEALVMEKLLDQTVYSKVEVSDMEVAAYYESHREDFDRPAQVRARQIVVAEEAEGQRILGLLRQGQAFADVAREYSLSPDSQDGGDLGFFGRGQMPSEFDAVVFNLPVGRLSDLVKSEYGYHIFLVDAKRKATRLSKQDAEQEIRQVLMKQQQEMAYQDWLQNLRAQAVIEVDWAQLDEEITE
jgi:peptidyl-prolyl cis-trans isomerase C